MWGLNLSKYHNTKVEWNGIKFDSIKEYNRYFELKLMAKTGDITALNRQVSFCLIPAYKLSNGKVERAVEYIADFTYVTKDGRYIVEDVKGYRTKEYKLKRKMMLDQWGIEILET